MVNNIFSYEDVNISSSNLAEGVFPQHKHSSLFRVLGRHIPNIATTIFPGKSFCFSLHICRVGASCQYSKRKFKSLRDQLRPLSSSAPDIPEPPGEEDDEEDGEDHGDDPEGDS